MTYFDKRVAAILYGLKFDVNWKDDTNKSKIIITIPEIPKNEVEGFVTKIMGLYK